MKTKILMAAAITFCAAVFFVACKKNNSSSSSSVSQTTQLTTQANDQSQVSTEVDASANDADVALESTAAFSGRGQQGQGVQGLICDATIAIDTTSNPRTITITYNGTNCLGNRTRTGQVIISMPQGIRWKNAGAAITFTFNNLKITRLRDTSSITINGSETYTNVSGGLLINLATLGTITHTITSNGMTITFNNGAQRSWQVAKQRVYTYNNGIVITATGTHTSGSVSGISEWGTNRYGNVFTTAIAQPIVIRQDCSFRITAGQVVHTRAAMDTSTVTFGLDATGNPTTCPGTGTYYMKIVWVTSGGVSHTVIVPY